AQCLSANIEEPWTGLALVIDADDHALSAALVLCDQQQLFLQGTKSWTSLGVACWKNRLIDTFADRCIRQSRRDPRDCPQTEQHPYEQLDSALDRYRQDKPFEILLQTAYWYQNLLLRPADLATGCQKLAQSALAKIQEFLTEMQSPGLTRIFLSRTAE